MSEKTEAPTPRRLSQARSEGQLAKSHELTAAASLLAGVWLLQGVSVKMISELKGIMTGSMSDFSEVVVSGSWLRSLLAKNIMAVVPSLSMLLGGLLLVGLASNLGQTGFVWAQKRLGFHFDRLNLLTGLKRMFSSHGLVELVKAMFKLLIVGWVTYSFLRTHSMDFLVLGQTDLVSAFGHWGSLASALALRIGFAYLVLALIDYGYQYWTVHKAMMMTKEEIKEDFKSSEGDPFIRSRIRGQQRRMARMRMMRKVPQADVIITNPTHLAVAIIYNSKEMNAPRVVAKGADHMAERIKEIGRKHSIPIVENKPIARALFNVVEIDQEVPPELYVALAEVLAYVYRLRGRTYRPASV